MKTQVYVIFVSVMFAVLLCMVDAYLDSVLFYDRTFGELLLFNVPTHEIYIRLSMICSFILFALVVNWFITKQKRTECHLKEQSYFLQTLIDTFPIPIYYKDERGIYLGCNHAFEDLTGFGMQDIQGKTVEDLFPEHEARMARMKDRELFETQGRQHYEYQFKTAKGRTVIASMNKATFVQSDGTVAGLIGMIYDITDRKQHEEALRSSEDRIRRIFETCPDAISITRLEDGQFVDTNQGLFELVGFTKEEVLGKTTVDLNIWINPDDRKEMVRRLERDGAIDNWEIVLRHKNGATVPCHMSARLIDIDDVPYLVTVIRNIQTIKEAEAAIRESEKRYRTLFEELPIAIWEEDFSAVKTYLDSLPLPEDDLPSYFTSHPDVVERCLDLVNIKYINRFSLKLCQSEHCTDLLNCGLRHFLEKPYKTFQQELCAVAQNKRHMEYECQLKTSQGSMQFILVRWAALPSDEHPYRQVLVSYIDITDKKKMEEEIANARRLESLGILAGGIAHDFNNILTAIIGNISLAKMIIDPNDRAQDRLDDAEKAFERANDLTRQLLTFSKGGAPIKTPVSLTEIVTKACREVLADSNIGCRFDIAGDVWHVHVDSGQIGQVVRHIILNAKQAMPDGGTIELSIANGHCAENSIIRDRTDDDRIVQVTIRDRGVGIQESDLPLIFDPFFSTKPKSTGLGLATAYSIIKKHGGHIYAQSNVNEGTTVTIELPAMADDSIPARTLETPASEPGKKTILIMDDEISVRRVIRAMLEELGYAVSTCKDGNEAIELYRNQWKKNDPFDAVIMDLTIPGGMGGAEAVQKILAFDPNAKVLLASGYSNDPVMANYRKNGFQGILSKPFSLSQIKEALFNLFSMQP